MTAVKLRIKDLVEGTCDGRSVSTLFGEVSEARILGTLIDIFIADDENYMSLTVDDGTETVRVKAWRQDVGKLKKFSKGDLIEVVGKVREYNEEIYLTPEVVLKISPNKWVLRELELMKLYVQSGAAEKISEREESLEEEIESEFEEEPEIEFTGADEGEIEKEAGRQKEREERTEPQKESKEEEIEEIAGTEEEHPKEEKVEKVEKESKVEELEKESKVEELEKESKVEELEKESKVEKEEGEDTFEEEYELGEIEEFKVLGEDEVVETVLELLQEDMTKEMVIEKSGLDEIDVELALRELMDEGKVKKEGNTYKKAA